MSATKKCQMIFLLFLVILMFGICNGELPKPSYTRTVLKVSRSLPSEMEELKVQTREGNLATLIVKRRDKPLFTFDDSKLASKLAQKGSNVTEENKTNSSANIQLNDKKNEVGKKNEVRKLGEASKQIRMTFTRSPILRSENLNEINQTNKKPVSERNQFIGDSAIDYENWTSLSADGNILKKEELEKVKEYQNWKPLQTKIEEKKNYDRSNSARVNSSVLFARNFHNQTHRNFEFDNQNDNDERALYMYMPRQSPSRTNIGANLSKNRGSKTVPPEVIVRSEINVKTAPKRSPMSLDSDGMPIIHGTRMPDEPIDKTQIWRNARVINNKLIIAEGSAEVTVEPFVDNVQKRQDFETFFKDVNRRYGRTYDEAGRNAYFEWDPRNYKNETLKPEIYDHHRTNIYKRMLHSDNIMNYPKLISQRYNLESQTIAPVALKSSARMPVLQYAHPELGVQPAKILKNEKRRPDNFPENQHSFTEQRHKKKYMLNDKNFVDSYTVKNYYPNLHFYGLKRPKEPPFWVKISENLKNQFSTGVERVSQFTRPVIDPLVEATHKISQNLGLSKGKEAQDKIGTVASGTSILIPALGLVASGAALGIGAVAVGRYLDVEVLKRSNENLEHKRALEVGEYLKTMKHKTLGSNEASSQTLYVLQNVPQDDKAKSESASSMENDRVFLIFEDDKQLVKKDENQKDETGQAAEKALYMETNKRRRRSADYLDIFKMDIDVRNLVRKRFQRKGADSFSDIVEIDLPIGSDRIDIIESLVPKKNKERDSNENIILIVKDDSKILTENLETDTLGQNAFENTLKIADNVIDNSQDDESRKEGDMRNDQEIADGAFSMSHNILQTTNDNTGEKTIGVEEIANTDLSKEDNKRRKRNIESDQELLDALQNLKNAEVAKVADIQGDWTNTPCAKRVFCDMIIQSGSDASLLMGKKVTVLLSLEMSSLIGNW